MTPCKRWNVISVPVQDAAPDDTRDFEKLRSDLEEMLKPGESTIIYRVSSEKMVDRTVFGDDPAADDQFL